MSLTSSEMSAADIAAITGNSRGNNGFGYDGGSLFYLIILFLFFGAFNGGWGNNGGGNGAGSNGFGLYPWMNQNNQINDGFRDQMLNSQINGIQSSIISGFGDVQNSLCGGFAGVNATINNAQMANMQQMFGLQSALQNCCCENRANIADLKYTVATENCADRTQSMMNTRDIIQSQNQGTQAILDKLCQLELDGLKQDNQNLRTQLNMANLAASQVAQTAELRQSGATQLNQLVSELRSCPIPAQPVYGSQPIFTCGGNSYGCSGCGCGA